MRVFLSWWFAQLAGLLPDFLTRGASNRADAVILDLDANAVTLLIRSQGATTSIGQSSAGEAGLQELAQILRAEKSVPHLLLLRLPVDWVLQKRLTFPIAARRDLKNLLGFEIDRETPFAREEIYWSFAVRPQDQVEGRLEVDLFIVPRRSADPVIEAARRAGLAPAAVEVDTGSRGVSLVPLATETLGAREPSEPPRIRRLATAGALALIALVGPFAYQEWAIASADATIASLESQADEAAALRQSADQRARTIDFFQKSDRRGSALTTLAAVTRSLPDDTYLTALTLRGTRLTMSGLSPSAAQLVGLLAHSPLFREPSFDSPVVGSESGNLENFTISVNLAQAVRP